MVIRPVTSVGDLRLVAGAFSAIWDAPVVAPMPHDLMRSLVHAGGCVHAAFRADQIAGATVAVFGPPAETGCYSLIAGVQPGRQSRGIGLALKLAQRAWALRAGATHMTWTFDPLLRRNAAFNLTRLGATVTEYLVDFYGAIPDGVNDPETDRVAVSWDLRAPLPGPRRLPAAPSALPPEVLAAGPGDEPAVCPAEPGQTGTGASGSPVRCAIPADILAIRRHDPELARRWRLGLRAALGGALARGYRVTGMGGVSGPEWYVLERGEERR